MSTATADPISTFTDLWADKPNRGKAVAHAIAYVDSHEAELTPAFGGRSREEVIAIVREARASGDEVRRVLADMWMLARFEQQVITGVARLGG